METNSSRYGIYGKKTQISYFIEFPAGSPGVGNYFLKVGLPDIQVKTGDQLIFEGGVNLSLLVEPGSGTIAIFQRLMHPFEGRFDFIVDGSLTINGKHAELESDQPIVSSQIHITQ